MKSLPNAVEFTITRGADLKVDVNCPSLVRWRGRVHLDGGSSVARMTVRPVVAPPDARSLFVLAKDGAFDIQAIQPGEYDVAEWLPELPRDERPQVRVTVPDVPEFERDVVLKKP